MSFRLRSWLTAACATTVAAAAFAALPVGPATAATPTPFMPTSVTFTTAGEHAWQVPAGVTSIHVVAIGGHGGRTPQTSGGLGARVEADVPVHPGATLYAEVGGNGLDASDQANTGVAGGANGGGASGTYGLAQFSSIVTPSSGGGGGGASDLQTCSSQTCSAINHGSSALLVVAGGGGGAGAYSVGGNGGQSTGGDAVNTGNLPGWGLGGTESGERGNSQDGTSQCGSLCFLGGNGDTVGGGGGGGGYYPGGGGLGGTESEHVYLAGGGGGGASHGPSGTTYGLSTLAPQVVISYPYIFTISPSSGSLNLDVVDGKVFQEQPTVLTSQRWAFGVYGYYYYIENVNDGLCITTSGVSGAQLSVAGCNPTDPGQQWVITATGTGRGTVMRIVNASYYLFMEVNGRSTAPGAAIDAGPDNGGFSNQYFYTLPG